MQGLIAGNGDAVREFVHFAQKKSEPLFVVGIKGFVNPDAVNGSEFQLARLGQSRKIIDTLKKHGIQNVCFLGGVGPFGLRLIRPDRKFLQSVLHSGLSVHRFLSSLIEDLESEGLTVAAPQDVIPEFNVGCGALGSREPDPDAVRDIEFVREQVKAEASRKKACIVKDGAILATETTGGTDAMLQAYAKSTEYKQGAILVKIPHPRQDRRIDVPVIGRRTVELAAGVGLAGIAVESGHCVFCQKHTSVELADQEGIFIFGV